MRAALGGRAPAPRSPTTNFVGAPARALAARPRGDVGSLTKTHRRCCRACVRHSRVNRGQESRRPDSRATGAPNACAARAAAVRHAGAHPCFLPADCEFSISDILPHSAGGLAAVDTVCREVSSTPTPDSILKRQHSNVGDASSAQRCCVVDQRRCTANTVAKHAWRRGRRSMLCCSCTKQ